MTYKKQLSIQEREKKLKELINDAIMFNFSRMLINAYQKQLSDVQKELKYIKKHRIKWITS